MDPRWNLPSNVEEDGESRVPTLGLHQYGLDMDQDELDGFNPKSEERFDSQCDSGVGVDSFRSDSLTDSFRQFNLRDSSDTLTALPKPDSFDSSTSTHLPIDIKLEQCDSVDEAYASGAGLSSYNPEEESSSLHLQCSEESGSQVLEDSLSLQRQKTEELYRIYSQDEDGDTQLHIAVIQKLSAMALQMIAMTEDPDYLSMVNNLCQTPLHLATITKQPIIIRRLIARGAALDVRDRNGNTALHLACRDGSLDCVKALTLPLTSEELRGAPLSLTLQQIPQDTDIMNYDGETCLHLAAAHNHTPVITYLVGEHVHANINIRDGRSGRTVLHHAVESGRQDLVFFLIHCGAEVNLGTFDNTTALQLAAGLGYQAIEALLIQAGADSYDGGFDETLSDSDDDMMESLDFDDLQIAGQPIRV